MILDEIKNIRDYEKINTKLIKAHKFLASNKIKSLLVGRYEIDGDNIFALVQKYKTKPHSKGVWEAHQKYVDVQCLVKGEELVGYANLDQLRIVQKYKPKEDYLLLKGKGEFFCLKENQFAIFLPQDAHMPGIRIGKYKKVKKVVIKVRL